MTQKKDVSGCSVALFVPCYVAAFYPEVGAAARRVLEAQGCRVETPGGAACCGQPMANAGFAGASAPSMQRFVETFAAFDYVVVPSGSCAYHVRAHYDALPPTPAVRRVRANTYELCAFLTDVLAVERLDAAFPHRVGLHQGCHGLRGLRLGPASELPGAGAPDRARQLLGLVEGLELVDLARADECCGFGGTFAVGEEAVSVAMGRDRLRDHLAHRAEVITSADMSCLMHLGGLARREGLPVSVLHVAEILAGGRGEEGGREETGRRIRERTRSGTQT